MRYLICVLTVLLTVTPGYGSLAVSSSLSGSGLSAGAPVAASISLAPTSASSPVTTNSFSLELRLTQVAGPSSPGAVTWSSAAISTGSPFSLSTGAGISSNEADLAAITLPIGTPATISTSTDVFDLGFTSTLAAAGTTWELQIVDDTAIPTAGNALAGSTFSNSIPSSLGSISFAAIPEPSSFLLLCCTSVALFGRNWLDRRRVLLA